MSVPTLRVLVYNRFADRYVDLLGPRFPAVSFSGTTTDPGFRQAVAEADVLVAWKSPREVLPRRRRCDGSTC